MTPTKIRGSEQPPMRSPSQTEPVWVASRPAHPLLCILGMLAACVRGGLPAGKPTVCPAALRRRHGEAAVARSQVEHSRPA